MIWSGLAFAGYPDNAGVVGLGAVTRSLSPRLGYRVDGWIGQLRRFEGRDGLAFGSSAGLQVVWTMAGAENYAGGGISYNHTRLSASKPIVHDLGTMLVYGFQFETGGRAWFVETSARWFGNMFRRKDITRSVMFITTGVAF